LIKFGVERSPSEKIFHSEFLNGGIAYITNPQRSHKSESRRKIKLENDASQFLKNRISIP